jgi:hypothetical protein
VEHFDATSSCGEKKNQKDSTKGPAMYERKVKYQPREKDQDHGQDTHFENNTQTAARTEERFGNYW